MASDSDYDNFDYDSTQDSFDIDYQIDLFEFRYYVKSTKAKQKIKKYSCPISVKTCRSHTPLIRVNCTNYKITPKAERKSFRYDHYPRKTKHFECDEQFEVIQVQSTIPVKVKSDYPKKLADEHLESFSKFRRHFYRVEHQAIKSSLTNVPNIEIADIRLAPINESVQNDFLQRLHENSSCFPQLVYHGTELNNIASILRYGFLIPNQAHPSNSEAPIIVSAHGQAYGKGIYCSQTADYSLSYMRTTNTLLVCAAIPKRDNSGKFQHRLRHILVLPHVSQIIPLFLFDFKYLNSGINRPLYYDPKELKIEKNKQTQKSGVSSRKYLRKMLNYMNDEARRNNQYQVRSFE
jgi:hypothetical protein